MIRRLGLGPGRVVGVAVGIALVGAVFAVAGPAQIWGLIRSTSAGTLAAAGGWYVVATVLRGARLHLLLEPGERPWTETVLVATAAQTVAIFAPARLGELALPWLLARSGGRAPTEAVGTLLLVRAIDLAGLAVWATVAIVARQRLANASIVVVIVLLVAPLLLLPAAARAAVAAARRLLMPCGHRGRRWTRRLRRLRVELDSVTRRPARWIGSLVASVAVWGSLWAMTSLLLAAMGHDWSWWTVVAGSAAASAASAVPIAVVAGLGPLEAGWTAAFAALGIPLETAAATGVACHVWSLLFTAAAGAAAWLALSVLPAPPRSPGGPARGFPPAAP